MKDDQLKILVTGAAGFLGSHLSEKLKAMGHDVVGIDNMAGGYEDNIPKNIEFHKIDCCDFEKVKVVMKNIDVVYHCAATAHEGLSVFSPFEITKNNFLASVSIFSAGLKRRERRERREQRYGVVVVVVVAAWCDRLKVPRRADCAE